VKSPFLIQRQNTGRLIVLLDLLNSRSPQDITNRQILYHDLNRILKKKKEIACGATFQIRISVLLSGDKLGSADQFLRRMKPFGADEKREGPELRRFGPQQQEH
jgi:hypothetical protein